MINRSESELIARERVNQARTRASNKKKLVRSAARPADNKATESKRKH